MTVIGFSSGVVCRDRNVDRRVKAVLQKSGIKFAYNSEEIVVRPIIPYK